MYLNSDRGPVLLTPPQESEPKPKERRKPNHDWLLLTLGVILPLIALYVESSTHWCAQHYFDPLPTALHTALFSLIPISNFMVWLTRRCDMMAYCGPMILWGGMASGVAFIYTMMFLPLTPMFGMTALLGIGLLGLAPLISLITLHISGHTACRFAAGKGTYFNPTQLHRFGHIMVILCVLVIELPSTVTRIGLHMAASPDLSKQIEGLNILRTVGNQEVMLRACYEHSGRATDILGTFYDAAEPLPVESARDIFYRVTGRPFNSVPIPESAQATLNHARVSDATGLNANVKDEFDFDPDIAGETVAGMARGLSVKNSKIRGTVNTQLLMASLDWTMDFRNSTDLDRELRARILLPEHAVVTAASVIVNGKELPATIMERYAARQIYTSNVLQKKDPLLVSTCGNDRILIQCYPIRKNLNLSCRLRIAVPLTLDPHDKTKARFQLPSFEERNFQVEAGKETSVSLKAASGEILSVPDTTSKTAANALEDTIASSTIARGDAVITVERPSGILHLSPSQTSPVVSPSRPKAAVFEAKRIAIVIDGSSCMKPFIKDIAQSLQDLPHSCTTTIFFAGDQLHEVAKVSSPSDIPAAINAVKQLDCVGGQDCAPAMAAAIARVVRYGEGGARLVWIHGPQPNSSPLQEAIRNSLWAFSIPILWDLQVCSGPVSLYTDQEVSAVRRIDRTGSISQDLSSLFMEFDHRSQALQVDRKESCGIDDPFSLENAKLWAATEVGRLRTSGREDLATSLAERYQIVSSLTSAVVVPNDSVIPPEPMPVDTEANYVTPQTGPAALLTDYGNAIYPFFAMVRMCLPEDQECCMRASEATSDVTCSGYAGASYSANAVTTGNMPVQADSEPYAAPVPLAVPPSVAKELAAPKSEFAGTSREDYDATDSAGGTTAVTMEEGMPEVAEDSRARDRQEPADKSGKCAFLEPLSIAKDKQANNQCKLDTVVKCQEIASECKLYKKAERVDIAETGDVTPCSDAPVVPATDNSGLLILCRALVVALMIMAAYWRLRAEQPPIDLSGPSGARAGGLFAKVRPKS